MAWERHAMCKSALRIRCSQFSLLSLKDCRRDERLKNYSLLCELSDGRPPPWRLEAKYWARSNLSFGLTSIGPCIIIYSYSTTKKVHLFLKLFILVKLSTCFGRSFRPSSGALNCTYGNRHMSNSCLLPTSGGRQQQVATAVWLMPVAVCAV